MAKRKNDTDKRLANIHQDEIGHQHISPSHDSLEMRPISYDYSGKSVSSSDVGQRNEEMGGTSRQHAQSSPSRTGQRRMTNPERNEHSVKPPPSVTQRRLKMWNVTDVSKDDYPSTLQQWRDRNLSLSPSSDSLGLKPVVHTVSNSNVSSPDTSVRERREEVELKRQEHRGTTVAEIHDYPSSLQQWRDRNLSLSPSFDSSGLNPVLHTVSSSNVSSSDTSVRQRREEVELKRPQHRETTVSEIRDQHLSPSHDSLEMRPLIYDCHGKSVSSSDVGKRSEEVGSTSQRHSQSPTVETPSRTEQRRNTMPEKNKHSVKSPHYPTQRNLKMWDVTDVSKDDYPSPLQQWRDRNLSLSPSFDSLGLNPVVHTVSSSNVSSPDTSIRQRREEVEFKRQQHRETAVAEVHNQYTRRDDPSDIGASYAQPMPGNRKVIRNEAAALMGEECVQIEEDYHQGRGASGVPKLVRMEPSPESRKLAAEMKSMLADMKWRHRMCLALANGFAAYVVIKLIIYFCMKFRGMEE